MIKNRKLVALFELFGVLALVGGVARAAEHFIPSSMYILSRNGIIFKTPGGCDVVDWAGNGVFGHSDSNYFKFTYITADEGQVRIKHNGQMTKLFRVCHAVIIAKDQYAYAGVPFRLKCKLTNPLGEKVSYLVSPVVSDEAIWYDVKQKFVFTKTGFYAFDLYTIEPGHETPGRVYITVLPTKKQK